MNLILRAANENTLLTHSSLVFNFRVIYGTPSAALFICRLFRKIKHVCVSIVLLLFSHLTDSFLNNRLYSGFETNSFRIRNGGEKKQSLHIFSKNRLDHGDNSAIIYTNIYTLAPLVILNCYNIQSFLKMFFPIDPN